MSMLIFSLLHLFIVHNIKSLRQLKCFVIFYLQKIFHIQFIDIFIMLLCISYSQIQATSNIRTYVFIFLNYTVPKWPKNKIYNCT